MKMNDYLLIYEPKKSIEVLGKTELFLNSHQDLKEKIINLRCSYQSIGKAIPMTNENIFSGHFFPYTESNDELQVSFNLVMFGLYKQAFMSLRSALELGLLSVYYNINDEGHQTVKDWLKSKDSSDANTPTAKKIWSVLYTNTNIKRFDQNVNIKKRFDNLRYLHNYVHTKGHRYSNQIGMMKSNWQTFEEKGLIKWFHAYENIVILIITLHMLKYPITSIKFDWSSKVGIDNPFPVLESFEIDRIKEMLPNDYFDEIKNIALMDNETQELYEHIVNIPDMTDTQIEDQILNFNKMTIKHGVGFIEWEKRELEYLDKLENHEKKEALHRIKIIREWATEHNMMKPKLERLKDEGFFNNSTEENEIPL